MINSNSQVLSVMTTNKLKLMHNNMGASHTHEADLKKTGTKEYELYHFLNNKLNTWQNYYVRSLDIGIEDPFSGHFFTNCVYSYYTFGE